MRSNWYTVAGLLLVLGLCGLSGGKTLAEPHTSPDVPPRSTLSSSVIGNILPVTPTPNLRPSVYWGAYIATDIYGLKVLPPWDMKAAEVFESHTGKKISILHWGRRWLDGGAYYPFDATLMENVRQYGAISLLTWDSEDYEDMSADEQARVSLRNIINGTHDNYIRQWATAAKNWGYPFFLRFNPEMNGDWEIWSELNNGNKPGEYAQAWRHVRDIFTQVGATNVTWVWCPNVEYADTIPLEGLYPGNAYVDWTCMDGYNWGNRLRPNGKWQTFYEIFKPTYDHILRIAPGKPMMIGETASSE